jgi:hypothetical protein
MAAPHHAMMRQAQDLAQCPARSRACPTAGWYSVAGPRRDSVR